MTKIQQTIDMATNRLQEIENITSIALSSDNRFVAVNLTSQEIHVWDLEMLRIVDKFSRSLEMGRYVIRICFGGYKDAFLVSGSEGLTPRKQSLN